MYGNNKGTWIKLFSKNQMQYKTLLVGFRVKRGTSYAGT